jgi:transposase
MKKSNQFFPEVRMVQVHRSDYPSLWAVIESIAPMIGCVPQTLNEWVKRVEVEPVCATESFLPRRSV